ncbi:MAG TPA: class I SAM-dependent methyltransferase [Thermomicrobiales bacterium]|nr:class I SAM-dependent methyltransferase [Thermomicrobiales bacterium]
MGIPDQLASIHKLYGEIWASTDPDFETEIAKPRAPRSPELLFDYAAQLGLGPDSHVLDIGARDAVHAIELARRHGCHVVAADPVPFHLGLARQRLEEAQPEVQALVELSDATMEHMPFEDESFDLVWARDMLNHVALRRGLGEAYRVLKPGTPMLVFQTFATPLLEQGEARRLYEIHSVIAENMDSEFLEDVTRTTGFEIETVDEVGSEWREYRVESGMDDIGQELMTLARMRRTEHELVQRFGRNRYEATIADILWGVYLLLGKLSSRIYIFRKPGSIDA